MNFYYNYFEEDSWENAGYNLGRSRVWSNKIGWREFNWTVIAAYVLETLYTDGTGAVFENGDLVDESIFTGWINYLFHEDFHAKNRNPWKLFDLVNTETDGDDYKRDIGWKEFAYSQEGFDGYTEIYAVQNGIDRMWQWLTDLLEEAGVSIQDDDQGFNFFTIIRLIVKSIRTYRKECDLPVNEQFQKICDHLKAFYQNPDLSFSDFTKN
ncbi:MAG: hypothetical protein LUE92_03670 [Clostridiales bacterium]|nr:hypothetical protein [Clostridiales bacterium]